MLLAIDIGNSSIKFGVYDRETLISKFYIPTRHDYSASEIKRMVGSNLTFEVDAAIASSVVPEVEEPIREFLNHEFGIKTVFVRNLFDFGLKIKYDPVSSVGTDRLIDAFAAVQKYGSPCIVCDFGTATTIDAVNSDGEYLGGAITPGMNTLSEALHLKTSKLPRVPIEKPLNVIGNTTVGSIQTGIFYGYIGLVEGILTRMIAELLSVPPAVAGGLSKRPGVIATGGFAKLIAENCELIEIVDENLILDGLQMIARKRVEHEAN